MKLKTLGGFDPDTLRPLSTAEIYRQTARRAAIDAEMQAVAKASERTLPIDEQRQIIDLSELRAFGHECAVVLPFAALATVCWFACNIP